MALGQTLYARLSTNAVRFVRHALRGWRLRARPVPRHALDHNHGLAGPGLEY